MYICIVLLVAYGLLLVPKAFGKTYVFGISIEIMSKKWNGILLGLISMVEIIKKMKLKAVAEASGLNTMEINEYGNAWENGIIQQGFNIVFCFFILMTVLAVFVLFRYLFGLIDIVMVPICTVVPFVSSIKSMGKLIFVMFMFILSFVSVETFVMLMICLILVSILLLRMAYLASRYFKNIYAKPLFIKVFYHYNKNMPLIAKKIPAKVKKYIEKINPDLVIPVYLKKTVGNMSCMHKYDCWWLVSADDTLFLLKPNWGKKDCYRISLSNLPEHKIYINQTLFYYEIFNLQGSDDDIRRSFRKKPKQYHFVFSLEYYYRYNEIKQKTGFIDYKELKKMLKQDKFKKKRERILSLPFHGKRKEGQ